MAGYSNSSYYPNNQMTAQINTMPSYQNNVYSTVPTSNYSQSVRQTQTTYIPGRMITKENDILPSEVPMDGNLGIFVQQDLKRIYAKTWGGDGLIHTNVYELVNGQGQSDQNDPMKIILERLDRIEDTLKNGQKVVYRKPNYRNNKQNSEKNKGE